MYIWVVLATFITLLYSFNLAIRGDERKLAVEPLAEAEISRFVIHHRMAQKYIMDHSLKTATNPGGVTGGVITYGKGPMGCSDEILDSYRPFGFNCNDDYTMEVYCAHKNDWSTEIEDCTSQDAVRFLITYGPIPTRWLNQNSGTPNNDFLNALQTVIGIDTSVGYATKTGIARYKWEVKGREDETLYLPNVAADTGGFSTTCTCSSCDRCLVYFTTYE